MIQPIEVNASVTYYGKDGAVVDCTATGNCCDESPALHSNCVNSEFQNCRWFKHRDAVVIETKNGDREKIPMFKENQKYCTKEGSSNLGTYGKKLRVPRTPYYIYPLPIYKISCCHRRPLHSKSGLNLLPNRGQSQGVDLGDLQADTSSDNFVRGYRGITCHRIQRDLCVKPNNNSRARHAMKYRCGWCSIV